MLIMVIAILLTMLIAVHVGLFYAFRIVWQERSSIIGKIGLIAFAVYTYIVISIDMGVIDLVISIYGMTAK